ncbi:Bacterial membrane flanked domain protein [Novipirellula galeiformis]|uniref:Bacterial membrane flanked domain protein n=1 Tax=Novipirellula galeiformis TaxID=2528004 RepID=A0A5C6CJQ8_9BACT|nr:PH domain-containing protein [Novipirellula galeiformis]TWU24820.1 Bacterial membrane flanked domain protein [Novipirellula galeiformis]
MQVLTLKCPNCKHEVDTTIEHLDGPLVCPSCEKPFEVEMPTAVVSSVREVESKPRETRSTSELGERTLVKVHPVVFRARPIATLVLSIVALAAVVLMLMSVTGMSLAGYSLNETMALGPVSLLTWFCLITLLTVAAVIGRWMLLSQFTTLTVTNDRTIYCEGIVSRQTSEVQHDDVRNIQLNQTFIQRLLNVGDVGISSSGQDDLEVVARRLPQPERIIEHIRENQA